jgi:hypothetical protein
LTEFVGPFVNDGIQVEVVRGRRDAILEFLFGGDKDVVEDGAGELGKKPSTRLSPETCFGVKVNSKRPAG